MKITTRKSAKALKWVRIKAAFYSKGLFFTIVKLSTSKSALQDSVYGPTASRSILRNTNADPVPIQAQTETPYIANPIPIGHQSAANLSSMPGHLTMLGRQFIANPSSIDVNPVPI